MAERQYREDEIVELPPVQYKHYLRVLQRLEPSACKSIAETASGVLESVGAKTDLSKATTELFEGALDIDVGSMLTWMKKINNPKLHKRAVKQLQTIHATAMSRTPKA